MLTSRSETGSNFSMKIDHSTRVKPVTDERVLLDDSLRPMWTFLRWNGILPDFLGQETERGLSYGARFLWTLVIAVLIASYFVFELHQLFVEIPEMNSTYGSVIILSLLINGFFGLGCMYVCCTNYKNFQLFFRDWKALEKQSMEYFVGVKKRKPVIILYFIYVMMMVKIVFICTFWNMLEPNRTCFLSSNPDLKDALGVNILTLITPIFSYFTHTYQFLGELVPTLFFYHAGCVVEDLEREVEYVSEVIYSSTLNIKQLATATDSVPIISSIALQFQSIGPFSRIWEKYETILLMVNRANKLFGTSILFGYSAVFIYCSISCFMSIKLFTVSPALAIGFLTVFLCATSRMLLMNRLMSHLLLSCQQLKSTTAATLGRKWHLLPEEDRLVLTSFHARLDNQELSANPFDLYTVNPSNLMSILSLIVTYTIVLLQL